MTGLKRFNVGDRFTEFPGDSWNKIADFVEAPHDRPFADDPEENAFGIIAVKNISSVNIPKGGVMQPTGSMLAIPTDANAIVNQGPLIKVDEPDTSTGAEACYMIAANPIGAGLTGGGIRYGYVWARVNILDITDGYAQVINGDATRLETTPDMARAKIVDQETGTGEKWVLLDLGIAGASSSDSLVQRWELKWAGAALSSSTPVTVNFTGPPEELRSNATEATFGLTFDAGTPTQRFKFTKAGSYIIMLHIMPQILGGDMTAYTSTREVVSFSAQFRGAGLGGLDLLSTHVWFNNFNINTDGAFNWDESLNFVWPVDVQGTETFEPYIRWKRHAGSATFNMSLEYYYMIVLRMGDSGLDDRGY